MLKKLAILTMIMVLIPVLLVTTVMPVLIGMFVRPPLLHALTRTQALNVDIHEVRAGWFSSDIHISAESNIFSADGLSPVTQQGVLHLNHGPIMWHLYDTLFALADIRLLPAPGSEGQPGTRPEQPGAAATNPDLNNFSGAGLLRLNTRGYLQFEAITGFTAFAGDHWLETRASWPAGSSWQGWQTVVQDMQLTLSIDANATALLQSPAADALRVYQQQGWAHLANGRVRSIIDLQDGQLDINGHVMPISLFLDRP